jgi:hypothetical protein
MNQNKNVSPPQKCGRKLGRRHEKQKGTGIQVNMNQIGYIYIIHNCNRKMVHMVIGGKEYRVIG